MTQGRNNDKNGRAFWFTMMFLQSLILLVVSGTSAVLWSHERRITANEEWRGDEQVLSPSEARRQIAKLAKSDEKQIEMISRNINRLHAMEVSLARNDIEIEKNTQRSKANQ